MSSSIKHVCAWCSLCLCPPLDSLPWLLPTNKNTPELGEGTVRRAGDNGKLESVFNRCCRGGGPRAAREASVGRCPFLPAVLHKHFSKARNAPPSHGSSWLHRTSHHCSLQWRAQQQVKGLALVSASDWLCGLRQAPQLLGVSVSVSAKWGRGTCIPHSYVADAPGRRARELAQARSSVKAGLSGPPAPGRGAQLAHTPCYPGGF